MPLHHAAAKGDAKCVELLLEAKAPVDAKVKVIVVSAYAYTCPAVMLEDHYSVVSIILCVFQWTAQCEWIARNDTSTNDVLRMMWCSMMCAYVIIMIVYKGNSTISSDDSLPCL